MFLVLIVRSWTKKKNGDGKIGSIEKILQS